MKHILLIMVLLLIATAGQAASISFKWNPNTEPDLAGYVLYHSRTPDMTAPVRILQTPDTRATFNNISSGRPYYFAVTAKNTSGIESVFSDTVYYSQPLPPSSLQMLVNQLVIQ